MSIGIQVSASLPSVAHDPVLARWQAWVREAQVQGQPIRLQGGNSKAFYGRAVPGVALDTREYKGIVAYEPTELVITARCGTPLSEIDAVLAAQGQMLAFEPPHFSAESTIGGVLAAGLSGPRRMAAGAVRDFVLGVQIMDGRGDLLNFGGQVMKNVAGYDVSRLMAGSLGTLGLITEVSLKVVPQPRSEQTLVFACTASEALHALNVWAGQALPLSASGWLDDQLHLRLSGAAPAVAEAVRALRSAQPWGATRQVEALAPDAAAAFWCSLRDHTHAFFTASPGQALLRLALPDTTPPLADATRSLLEWGGAQRWLHVPADAETTGDHHFSDGDSLRLQKNPTCVALSDSARAAGGHASLFRPPAGYAGEVFAPLAAPLLHVHRQLKQAFDPAAIFNRGRLYADL